MMKVKIEVSARHCHLSREHIDVLFGVGYELTKLRDLSIPGFYSARETVTLQVGNGKFQNMRIIGPINKKTQIEISHFDVAKFKIDAPVRLSGKLKNSAGGKLTGPKGAVNLTEGIIVPRRHIHCDRNIMSKLNLANGSVVSVRIPGEKSITLHNVVLRDSIDSDLIMHIDIDEANAAGIIGNTARGELEF